VGSIFFCLRRKLNTQRINRNTLAWIVWNSLQHQQQFLIKLAPKCLKCIDEALRNNLRKILCHLICKWSMLQSIWQQYMCALLGYVPSQCHLTSIVFIALDCNIERQLDLVISERNGRFIAIFRYSY